MAALLDLRFSVAYAGRGKVLDDVSLRVEEGETVGLAGQSGAGKSTLSLALLGLLEPGRAMVAGEALFRGRNLLTMSGRELRCLRGRSIGYVPQSPLASLNPVLTVAAHFRETWLAHRTARHDWKSVARATLEAVSLPADDRFLALYPRQLSVGLAQRVLIGLAILHEPELLIADEPTSALDLVTRSEILALLKRLNEQRRMAILHISHDLHALVASSARLAILAAGRIVECGPTADVVNHPVHAYTRQLLACAEETSIRRLAVAGEPAGKAIVPA
jgi:ABC-type dipeptide/oligopeptide/nickel transport system ATPase component